MFGIPEGKGCHFGGIFAERVFHWIDSWRLQVMYPPKN